MKIQFSLILCSFCIFLLGCSHPKNPVSESKPLKYSLEYVNHSQGLNVLKDLDESSILRKFGKPDSTVHEPILDPTEDVARWKMLYYGGNDFTVMSATETSGAYVEEIRITNRLFSVGGISVGDNIKKATDLYACKKETSENRYHHLLPDCDCALYFEFDSKNAISCIGFFQR